MKDNTITGLEDLRWLEAQGARFCRVTRWNDPGSSPGKKAFETGWQNKPLNVAQVQEHIITGSNVGMICGKHSGGICLLDADQDFNNFLQTFPLFENSPAIVRGEADKGKLLIKIVGPIPDPKKFYRDGERSPFFEFLSTGNQGVIPPSTHPAGEKYRLIHADQPIPELDAEGVSAICKKWTGEGLEKQEPAAPDSQITPSSPPNTQSDGLKEAVEARWPLYEIFKHFDRVTTTQRERNSAGWWLRLIGNGGLLLHENGSGYDSWVLAGQKGMGGGPFQAWIWCKNGSCQVPAGRGFYDLLVEMGQAGGVAVPSRQSAPAWNGGRATTQTGQRVDIITEQNGSVAKKEKQPKPTDDELADRYLANAPKTVYGMGEWRRYQDGIWPTVKEEAIAFEILETMQGAKYEGVRPSRSLLSSVVEIVRLYVSVPEEKWDADPDTVVCKNGALHVPTMELRPHSPEHYATFRLEFDYNPSAQAPIWQYFLETTIPDAADFLQEFAGLTLTPDTTQELAIWLLGPAGSGKSTFLEGLQAMLGERATLLGLADIERSRFALGNLRGKTLAVASEQPAIYMQASHILNAIISGEKIFTERKFKDPIEFYPRVKVAWAMNELPRVPDAGNGLFRRVKVVKFPPLEESKRDPLVKQAIKEEGAGILNWALVGLKRLRNRGKFNIPSCVLDTTKNFQQHNDIPALFTQERCLIGQDYKAQAQLLYDTYKTWCLDNGHKPMSSTALATEWERLGFDKYASGGRNYWRGIGIHSDFPEQL